MNEIPVLDLMFPPCVHYAFDMMIEDKVTESPPGSFHTCLKYLSHIPINSPAVT